MQFGVRAQNRWGLSGELDYTYSHAIDIQSGENSCCVSNPWVIKYDKGSGQYDRRHMLSANYVYKMPSSISREADRRHSVGGWELAGTFTDQTGTPNSVGFTGDQVTGDPIGLGGAITTVPMSPAR